jgi:hypothetical protein
MPGQRPCPPPVPLPVWLLCALPATLDLTCEIRRRRVDPATDGMSFMNFAPGEIGAAAAPLNRARSMSAGFYTDPEIFHREREKIFLKHGFFLCRDDQLPNPGDYRSFDTPGGRASRSVAASPRKSGPTRASPPRPKPITGAGKRSAARMSGYSRSSSRRCSRCSTVPVPCPGATTWCRRSGCGCSTASISSEA